jgi:hypothetical protein
VNATNLRWPAAELAVDEHVDKRARFGDTGPRTPEKVLAKITPKSICISSISNNAL